MDYVKFFDDVLKLNPNVRFVGVYNRANGDVAYETQKGKVLLMGEEIKVGLKDAYEIWRRSLLYSEKFGSPIYAMTQHSKINRMFFPYGERAIILVSTEPDFDTAKISEDVIKLCTKYADPGDF